jgi:hypothetical protein
MLTLWIWTVFAAYFDYIKISIVLSLESYLKSFICTSPRPVSILFFGRNAHVAVYGGEFIVHTTRGTTMILTTESSMAN